MRETDDAIDLLDGRVNFVKGKEILLFKWNEDEAEVKGQKSSPQRLLLNHPERHLGKVKQERKRG